MHPRQWGDLSPLTYDEVATLVTAEVGEGLDLEFKSEPYRHDHDGVREFLKDVSSLANTTGGTLVLGVEETNGIASALAPITSQ